MRLCSGRGLEGWMWGGRKETEMGRRMGEEGKRRMDRKVEQLWEK